MSEGVSAAAGGPAPAAIKSPKKASTNVSKGKAKAVPTHPKVSASISALKERGASSLQAIKKYMSPNYKVDIEKLSPFIRKYHKSAVAAGALVQTKGKEATGSFKLSAKPDKPSPAARKPKKDTGAAKSARPRQLPVRPGRSPGVPRSRPQTGSSRPSRKNQRQRRRLQHLGAPRNPRQQKDNCQKAGCKEGFFHEIGLLH
ncbi:hypothetical protein HPB47_014225 [Ixodes persulcatus]|uniref:Uncharacterized protein n=1 Tax=Ixodes persulcatus TaxID=34615 RepID=A0AC60R2V7_IXOPE|nr:hypothetical protein HPB47_014225 [Ixodes persulcatus]